MLDDLLSLTNSHEFEEYGTISLVGVRLEENMILTLDLNLGGDTDVHQVWEIECKGVLEHQISLGPCDEFSLHRDHVLLWPYIYPCSSVSFYGEAKNHLAVVEALLKQHVRLVGDGIPFDRFMNGNPVEMVGGRYGMLADGPMPLMESYVKVLESFGISSNTTEPRPAPYTNDELSGLAEVGVLILKKRCYFVATDFIARRLRDPEI
jgi:hypothetical protein